MVATPQLPLQPARAQMRDLVDAIGDPAIRFASQPGEVADRLLHYREDR